MQISGLCGGGQHQSAWKYGSQLTPVRSWAAADERGGVGLRLRGGSCEEKEQRGRRQLQDRTSGAQWNGKWSHATSVHAGWPEATKCVEERPRVSRMRTKMEGSCVRSLGGKIWNVVKLKWNKLYTKKYENTANQTRARSKLEGGGADWWAKDFKK